jgi:hypothetical protein
MTAQLLDVDPVTAARRLPARLRGDLIVDNLRIRAEAGTSAVRLGSISRASGFDD